MPDDDLLGTFEQLVLLALLRLGEDAYGMTVRREIEEHAGRSASLGAVYATLDRLEAKGYVSSRYGRTDLGASGTSQTVLQGRAAGPGGAPAHHPGHRADAGGAGGRRSADRGDRMSRHRPRPPDDLPAPGGSIRCLIRVVAPERYREAFLGDLIEEYETVIRPQMGPRRAAWWLWRQALGSVPPLLRMRVTQEVPMLKKTTIRSLLGFRLSTEEFDARLALWACSLAGVAIVPMAILALMRNHGGRAEFLLGVGLAVVAGLIFLAMGLVIRQGVARLGEVPVRRRWAEFASYLGCLGLLIGGIRAIPALGLGPAGIVLVLLLVGALSIAVLVLGHDEQPLPVPEGSGVGPGRCTLTRHPTRTRRASPPSRPGPSPGLRRSGASGTTAAAPGRPDTTPGSPRRRTRRRRSAGRGRRRRSAS